MKDKEKNKQKKFYLENSLDSGSEFPSPSVRLFGEVCS